MDKEKIVTIAIGLSIGILIALGFFILNKSRIAKKTPDVVLKVPTSKDTGLQDSQSANFSIDFPEDNSLTKTPVASISGSGQPADDLIITSNNDDQKMKIDPSGKFSTTVKLEDGENKIQIIYLNQNNSPIVINRTVTYEIN